MLTDRQKETIYNLNRKGIDKPLEIIKWCAESKEKPRGRVLAKKLGISPRRHSRKYFQEIINHYAQNNSAKELNQAGTSRIGILKTTA